MRIVIESKSAQTMGNKDSVISKDGDVIRIVFKDTGNQEHNISTAIDEIQKLKTWKHVPKRK